MRQYSFLAALVTIASPVQAFAGNEAANVHYNYNMGTAEYFVGRSGTGGFGFNCQDKQQEGYRERYLIVLILPDTSLKKGDKVVFSRSSEKIALTMDNEEAILFDGHENWEAFSHIWNAVRAGDGITVAAGSKPPMNLATAGAAKVMPKTPCGE
ncbi:hypothetical protein HNQ96_004957 [Aminobacter lissarensis]|uniref:Uncharacterized protein n=1 Tax=Aminobacter carboxidus TaxID=376165 RepID=A0A8E1WII9_9HYPH|nr:hypothetical protein [Aminobacter lissarensis]MBB6469068.1 hypothetical protein [Aminobacter lissarensis]